MKQRLYQTGQFARKAAVSVRTLHFYDQVGLLLPTRYTEAGYRLYSDEDFGRLQQILALKFLGLSLDEIKRCLRVGPAGLRQHLALQKAMMQEKRDQLTAVIEAIDRTEALLQTNPEDWDAIVRITEVIQMQQNNEWVKKYFTEEQLQKLNEVSQAAYTEEDRQKLAEWGRDFSEADQEVVSRKWAEVGAAAKRLAAAGADPAGAEAQAMAAQYLDLINQFTHGDPGVTRGLSKFWERMSQLPPAEAPIAPMFNQEEMAFVEKAVAVYKGGEK